MADTTPQTASMTADKPVLVLGFENGILQNLRLQFNVRLVISDDASADIKWSAFQYLTLDVPAVFPSKERADCLAYATSHFAIFSDIYSRRYHYVSEHVSEVWSAFMLMFHVSYDLIKKHNIETLIFSNIPHEGYDFVFYLIARFLNLKSAMCHQSPIPTRFFLGSDIDDFGAFDKSPKITSLEPTNYSLPASWYYMKNRIDDESYSFSNLLSEVFRNPRGIRVAAMRHYYAARYRRSVHASKTERKTGEKFIYFPLHLQPELTTSALGGAYADQLSALEILSRIMPNDHWIYVKDNPKQTEMQRGPLFFNRLDALKNVRLVDLRLSSVDLIKASEGVALITGTAGWEALFYGKPVLAFGRAWYLQFKGVTEYRSGITFEAFVSNKPPSSDVIVQTLDNLLTKTGGGVVDSHYAVLVPSFDDRLNAQSVSASLRTYLNSI